MAMTPSQLSIIVKSQGIEKAAQDLDKLAKAAASVDSETKAFVIAQSKLIESNKRVSQSSEATARGISAQELSMIKLHERANKMNATVDRQVAAQERLSNAVQMTARGISKQEVNMVTAHEQALKMNKALDEKAKRLTEANSRGSIWNNTLKSMAVAASAYIGINFSAGIFKSADAWSSMQSKLALATGSMTAAKVVQEDLYKISQNIRIPLEDTARLYNRLVHPLMMMGKSSKDTTDMVSSMGYALKLSGATGQEAASAMLQFSQSMNAGRLNGGEFNSIAEASPNILRAVEKELVRTGMSAELTTKGLKKLASEGKLTAQLVSDAMLRALPQWRKDFESLPLTVDGALVRIKNMWEKSIGTLAQDTGFAQNFTKLLGQLEVAIPVFAKAITSALTIAIDYAGLLAKALGVIIITLSISSLYEYFFGAKGIIAGLTAAEAGTKALAGAMRLLNSATGIIGLIVLAIWALIEVYDRLQKSKQTDIETSAKLVDWSKAYVNGLTAENTQLEKQIDLMREQQKLPKIDRTTGQGVDSSLGLKQLSDAEKFNIKLEKQKMLAEKAKNAIEELKKAPIDTSATGLAGLSMKPFILNKLEEEYKKQKENLGNMMLDKEKAEKTKALLDINAHTVKMLAAKQETDATLTQIKALTQYKDKAEDVYKKTVKLADEALEKTKKGELGGISQGDYNEQIRLAKKLRDSKQEGVATTKVEVTELQKLKIVYAELLQQRTEMEKYGVDDKRTKSEKEYTRLVEESKLVKNSALKLDYDKRIEQAFLNKELENTTLFVKAQMVAEQELYANTTDGLQKQVESVEAALQKQRDINEAYGKTAGELENISLKRAEDTLRHKDGLLLSDQQILLLEREIRARKELSQQNNLTASNDEADKADSAGKKLLEGMWDTSKIDKFENASTKALKGVAKGFAEVSKSLDKYKASQGEIKKLTDANSARFKANKISEIEYLTNKDEIERKADDYQIAAYASMADAAKNFFDEGTKGYQALDGISKVFHAAQLARNLVETGQLAVKAVVNQAGGDPYTAWIRMGAMVTAMAALGFAVGGGLNKAAGGMKAADIQKTQGGGTVFGDTEAKSESIKKSLELLKSSYDKLYPVNQGMLKALKNIESSMTGLSNLVLRSGGVVEGTNMGIATGQMNAKGSPVDAFSSVGTQMTKALFGSSLGGSIAKFINNLWGKTTQSIVDSGIQFGGSLASMQKGQGFNQYASVDTTTSSWFGLKKDTKNSVQTQGLNDELSAQFGLVFTNMQKSLEEAGKVLYGSSKGVTDALDSLVLSTSKISLKGLSGQALTDAINAVISKGLDEMAMAAFKSFDKYRQVGEGYAQTIMRVANTFATVNSIFDKLGRKLFETSDAGVAASMAFTGLFDSLEEMQGVASGYYEKFYTEAEKQSKITEVLKKQFTEMNLTLPTSAKAYRELVDNTSDPAKVAMLWKLSDAFSEVFGTIEQGAKELPQAVKNAFDSLVKDAERWLSVRNRASALKDEINVAMGNPQKNPATRMQQLWDAMAKDITPEQKLELAGELKDLMLQKYQIEKDSLIKLIDFGKQLRNYVDSLKVGNLSPLTVGQKLTEAQAQYQATFAKAQGGDTAAQGMLQGKADTYLQLAQTALASSEGYSAIFSEVTNGLDSLGIESVSAAEQANQTATAQLAELQRLSDFVGGVEVTANSYYNNSLTALTTQINLMDAMYQKMGIFDGMLSSIAGLPAEIAAAISGKVGNSFGNDEFVRNLYQTVEGRVGTQIDTEGYNYWMKDLMTQTRDQVSNSFVLASQENNNRASSTTSPLEVQIAALTAEVQGLREDQNLQTGALINAQVVSSETSTAAIVTATKEAVVNESWQYKLKPELM